MTETAIIALAGRRIDPIDAEIERFPTRNIPRVRRDLARLFVRENVLATVSSAACGSDLLGLEEAERLGLRRLVILPYASAKFRKTSVVDRPGEWGASFDRLIGTAEREGGLLTLGKEGGDPAYQATNQSILNHATQMGRTLPGGPHRLLAAVVWEGASRGENDLTDAFRREAIKARFEIHVVLTM